jgi:hypothetical protein
MNSSDYLRRKLRGMTTTIGYQSGQDSSLQTFKVQARATTTLQANVVPLNHSKPAGSIGNIMQHNGVTNVPTDAPTDTRIPNAHVSFSGNGQSGGYLIADMATNYVMGKVHCAVCSDAPSSEPYNIVIPCPGNLSTIKNAPGVTKCCTDDTSQLFRNNNELSAEQGRQGAFRTKYNLPNKLHGLRGPVVNSR